MRAFRLLGGMFLGGMVFSCGFGSDQPTSSDGDQSPAFLSGPASSSSSMTEWATIQLTASASDPEGATVTYVWSQVSPAAPMGTFSAASSANTDWRAPEVTAATTFTLRLTISDGRHSVTGDLDVAVADGPPNLPPVLGTVSVVPSALAGDAVQLTADATDDEGDTLTFTWTQTAPAEQGTFTNATQPNASWRSPAVGADTDFTIQVSVSDGRSTVTETRTVTVTTPHLSHDIQPIFNQNCTSCHGAPGSAQFDLTSGNAHASLVGTSATASNACGGTTRVAPGAPDTSILVKRIEGTTCGDRMPQNNPSFFENNPRLVVRIRSWILAGALDD